MVRFVIDEDMPRSTGVALSSEGYEVKDVRDHGYRGLGDEEIYRLAQREKAVLLTGDLGFSNILNPFRATLWYCGGKVSERNGASGDKQRDSDQLEGSWGERV